MLPSVSRFGAHDVNTLFFLSPLDFARTSISLFLPVLFFGEIVPSAFFTGPNQVEVAAKLVPLVSTVVSGNMFKYSSAVPLHLTPTLT